MPCRTDDDGYDTRRANGEAKKAREEADKVTRMLCGVLRNLKDKHPLAYTDSLANVDGLPEWWKKHQEWDERRVRDELEKKLKGLNYEQLQAISKVLQDHT